MDQGVGFDIVTELIELFFIGQLTENKKMGHFKKGRFLSKLLNGISPVAQDSFVAIQKGNSTFGCSGIFITKIQVIAPVFSISSLISIATSFSVPSTSGNVYDLPSIISSAVFAVLDMFKRFSGALNIQARSLTAKNYTKKRTFNCSPGSVAFHLLLIR